MKRWSKFGKIRKVVSGKDLCILTFGPIIRIAFEVKDKLKKKFSIEINSCHTLKPFDYTGLKKKFKKFKNIIIIEDHSYIGGLAELVKSSAYEFNYSGNIVSYSLKDKFIQCYGTHYDLLKKHGIDPIIIRNKIKNLLKWKPQYFLKQKNR